MRKIILNILGFFVTLLRGSPITKVTFLKQIYYAVYSVCRPTDLVLLQLQGFQLRVDPKDEGLASFLLTTGVYEPFETELLTSLLEKGDCALDIGANIGYHTVILGSIVGPEGKVISCEPCPENYKLLRRNIRLNNLADRVKTIVCAAGSRNGSTTLCKSKRNKGDHRIFAPNTEDREQIEVQVCAIDSLVAPGTPVKVVKMDIQGAELIALQGMTRVLQENKNLHLCLEFWPDALRRSGNEPMDLIRFLEQRGFQATLILEGAKQLKALSQEDLRKMAHSHQEFNLLFARKSTSEMRHP